MCGEGKAILVPSGGALQNFAEEAKSTDPLCLERVSPGKGFANRVLWKSRGWGTAFFTEDSFKDASAMLVGMKRGILYVGSAPLHLQRFLDLTIVYIHNMTLVFLN